MLQGASGAGVGRPKSSATGYATLRLRPKTLTVQIPDIEETATVTADGAKESPGRAGRFVMSR